ncbi:MAG: DUF3052 family protein [Acidobacteriota bacterium]|nr:DUF3052 family protein [Acidobacteriota bacterium]
MPGAPSATPLAKKLGIAAGHRVALVGASPGWEVPGLPAGVDLRRRARLGADRLDVVVAFFRHLERLRAQLEAMGRAVAPDGGVWVAWPRRAGGHTSDITDGGVREAALPLGLVDVKVAALDADWSGLKLVWRLERRAGLSAGSGPPARRRR